LFALKNRVATRNLLRASLLLDLGFATVLTIFTEDTTSPSYVFFVFAIIAVGCRSGLRSTVTVTLFSAALYLLAIVFLLHGVQEQFVMRAAYLAIAGYLIGFFGEQRARFESRLREEESLAERQKIARDLHDGYVQALAGVNLRLQSCRGMLSKGNAPAALVELTDLLSGVAREYDEVRSYIRWLANIEDHVVADAGAPLSALLLASKYTPNSPARSRSSNRYCKFSSRASAIPSVMAELSWRRSTSAKSVMESRLLLTITASVFRKPKALHGLSPRVSHSQAEVSK